MKAAIISSLEDKIIQQQNNYKAYKQWTDDRIRYLEESNSEMQNEIMHLKEENKKLYDHQKKIAKQIWQG